MTFQKVLNNMPFDEMPFGKMLLYENIMWKNMLSVQKVVTFGIITLE